jgi:hypothetical protein
MCFGNRTQRTSNPTPEKCFVRGDHWLAEALTGWGRAGTVFGHEQCTTIWGGGGWEGG